MSLKKILLAALIILTGGVLTTTAAQEANTADTKQLRWAEAGLTFEYPAEWQITREDPFEFILYSPADMEQNIPTYFGLQMGDLAPGESLESTMQDFASDLDSSISETTFGGVDAIQLALPDGGDGDYGLFIGYLYRDDGIALLAFQSLSSNQDRFDPIIEEIIASAEVDPLELNVRSLSEQLQASLEADEPLAVGDPDAPVTVVEVLDFSCPHCINYSNSVDRIVQDYVDPGQVRLEFVYVTFVGEDASVTATHAQYCATAQGYGWEMHDLLMNGFRAEGGPRFYTAENIVAAVEDSDLNIDTGDLETCINDETYLDKIERDDSAAEDYGVSSTPAILFGAHGESPTFMLDPSNGDPRRGGIPLLFVYSHLDDLLGVSTE